jgi:pimeloyl-ACP methyl ester carboxylesterase
MTMPVLLLQAESDPLQPIDSLEGLKEAFPDAKLQIVKGAGHFPQQECPEVVTNAIVSFIE